MKNRLKSAAILLSALCLSGTGFAQNQFVSNTTQGAVGTGDAVLVNELTITGTGTAKILFLGLGPSTGLPGALQDPTLVLSDTGGNIIAVNDNWMDTQAAEIMATGLAPTNSSESAILANLSPGTYVVVERGNSNTTGIGLFEFFNLSGSGSTASIVALGTRGGDGTAGGIPVVGLQLATQEKVLVRSLGPSLGLTGQMPDPTLILLDHTGSTVASNNDWQSSQQTEIQNSGLAPTSPQESALISTLTPGNYTAVGRANTGLNGIVFTQAYVLSAAGVYPGPPLPPTPPTPAPGPTPTPGGTPTPTPAPTPTPGATPTPGPNPGVLLNISTRLRVLTDPNQLIGGFIVSGTGTKRVVIRGIGPSLSPSVTGVLADTTLQLYQGNTLIVSNDNWKVRDSDGSSQQAEIEATTIPPTNDLESAIVQTLNPGSYTAILRGKNNTTGIGVVEAYDLDASGPAELANISTRGFVDTGDNAMIGGFIVGQGSARVIIRALGPSVPVPGTLADTTLELHDPNGVTIDTNDNWKVRDSDGGSQQAEIEATTVPPTNDLESALVETLAPGGYTAVVRGKNNTTGVGLVEAYRLNQ